MTKDGKDAEEHSKGSVEIVRVSFGEHILNWIEACQKELRNITNLNEALENYKNIVKKAIGKSEENIMSITTKILESEINFEIATEIFKNYHLIQKEMSDQIGKKIENDIGNNRIKYKNSFFGEKNDYKPIVYFSIDEKHDVRIYSKEFYRFTTFRLGYDNINGNEADRLKEILKDKCGNCKIRFAGLWEYELKPKQTYLDLYKLCDKSKDNSKKLFDLDELIDLFDAVLLALDNIYDNK